MTQEKKSYTNKDGDNVRIESDRIFISESLRNKVWDKCGGRCVKCGCDVDAAKAKGEELQINHIIPFKDGGKTEFENLNLLCTGCNIEGREFNKRSNKKVSTDEELTNPEYIRFCHEYIIDRCGEKAVERTGCWKSTGDSAAVQASRMLSDVKVQRYIEKLEHERLSRLQITEDYVISRLRDKAETSDRDADQIRALELLGKHRKLFTEQVDVKDVGKITKEEHNFKE